MKNKVREWSNASKTHFFKNRKESPLAPSIKGLAIYRKYLVKAKSKQKNPNLLVLGATPELRDLGLRLGFNVVTVEFNQKVIDRYSDLVQVKNRDKEIIIKGDWLKVPLKYGYFSAIVGDAALNNISLSKHNILLQRTNNWLIKGGYGILRQAVLPDKLDKINDFKINLEHWRKGKMNYREFHYRFRFMTFHKQSYNKKTKVNSGPLVFKYLKELYQKKVLFKKEYEYCLRFKSLISHTILRYNEFFNLFKKYFRAVKVEQEYSNKLDYFPIKIFIGKK